MTLAFQLAKDKEICENCKKFQDDHSSNYTGICRYKKFLNKNGNNIVNKDDKCDIVIEDIEKIYII